MLGDGAGVGFKCGLQVGGGREWAMPGASSIPCPELAPSPVPFRVAAAAAARGAVRGRAFSDFDSGRSIGTIVCGAWWQVPHKGMRGVKLLSVHLLPDQLVLRHFLRRRINLLQIWLWSGDPLLTVVLLHTSHTSSSPQR